MLDASKLKQSYTACKTCGGVRVLREIVASLDGTHERVIISCKECERHRVTYRRKRKT